MSVPVEISENSWKDKILYFLDQIYWLLRQPSNLRIVVIGPEDCGKTSVIRRFAGDIFYDYKNDPLVNIFKVTTLLEIDSQLKRFNTEIIEMPRDGNLFKNRNGIAKRCKNATGYVLVYDANSPCTYEELAVCISSLRKRGRNSRKHRLPPVVVVGNKCEECTGIKKVNDNIKIKDEVQASGLKYFSTSAQMNSGIYEAFDEIIEQCARRKSTRYLPFRKHRTRKTDLDEKLLLNEEGNIN